MTVKSAGIISIAMLQATISRTAQLIMNTAGFPEHGLGHRLAVSTRDRDIHSRLSCKAYCCLVDSTYCCSVDSSALSSGIFFLDGLPADNLRRNIHR